MNYIIDANNLAGKLDLLGEEDFDKKLIEMMKNYFLNKKIKVYLVFDSTDLMGDRFKEKNVTVIYTPRDNYYKSADDKIVELTRNYLEDSKEEVMVVTDDIELKEKVRKVGQENNKLFFKQATDFSEKLKIDIQEENNLSEDEKEKINDELLKIWK